MPLILRVISRVWFGAGWRFLAAARAGREGEITARLGDAPAATLWGVLGVGGNPRICNDAYRERAHPAPAPPSRVA